MKTRDENRDLGFISGHDSIAAAKITKAFGQRELSAEVC